MNKPKSIIVEIPILDSIDEMKVVNTFTKEQLWYVCAIAKAFEKNQSNWNSLREWLERKIELNKEGRTTVSGMTFKGVNEAMYKQFLDKMNELEGKVEK